MTLSWRPWAGASLWTCHACPLHLVRTPPCPTSRTAGGLHEVLSNAAAPVSQAQGPHPQARPAWWGKGRPQASPPLDWTSLPPDQLPPDPPSLPPQPPTPAVVPSMPGRLLGRCGVGQPEQDSLPAPRLLTLPPGLAQRFLHPQGLSWRRWSSGWRGTVWPRLRRRPRGTSGRLACTSALLRCVETKWASRQPLETLPRKP